MKGHFSHLFKPFAFVFVSVFLIAFCVLSRTSTANATLTPSERSFFGANNIIFVDCNQSGGGMAAPTSTSTYSGGVWKSQTYKLSEEQMNGLSYIIFKENSGNRVAAAFEASIMANLFEYYRSSSPKTPENLVDYVVNSGWFLDSRDRYETGKSIPAASNSVVYEAAYDVFFNGNRTIPPTIIEHDDPANIKSLKVNGEEKGSDGAYTLSNYIQNNTVIVALGDPYVFYAFANPEGTTISSSSEGNGTGDPFGYFASERAKHEAAMAQVSSTNPGNSSGGSSVNGSGTINTNSSGSVTNYKGDTILSADDIATITKNQPIYEEAVKNTNPAIPWQMLAAIHYREHHLSRTNPDNGLGIFQIGTDPTKYPKTDTDVSDEEFLTQAKEAAMLLTNKYKGTNYTPGTDDGVKYGFFAYNGVAPSYISQALALNTNPKLTQEQAEVGEGSPYVMNRYDKERDPTDSETAASNTWCQFRPGESVPSCPANNDFGAYLIYTALTGTEWQKTNGTTNTINPCQGANATAASGSGGCGASSIAEFAKKVAWPDENHYSEIKPEFAEAANAVELPNFGNQLKVNENGSTGAQSCDHFVVVVIRNTVDKTFPTGDTKVQYKHMVDSSDWTEIENLQNESNLQPGDVLVVPNSGNSGSGHIMIYVGNGKVAHASYSPVGEGLDHGRTGNVSDIYYAKKDGRTFHIFRSTSQENCNMEGGTTGSFDEGLKQIETEKNIKVGAAVSAPGNSNMTDVQVGGSFLSTKAGKTMSVPLAIAAKQKNVSTSSVTDPFGSKCSYNLGDAIKNAVAKDDNCAAWSLWSTLGENDSAATTISDVLKAGKATDITVNSTKSGNTITPNTTDWGLVSQAIFAANMSSISDASDILSAMKSHTSTNNNGLNNTSFSSAMTAGGSSDGVTRQFGIVKLSNGKCSAISIAADGASKFSVLDDIVGKVLEQQNNLPSGTCPSGL